MSADLNMSELVELPAELDSLVDMSLAEGFRFLRRLVEQWRSGANRFSAPGEALFAARHRHRLVGICGLNRDPYCADPTIGRLRHLYVVPAHRGRGIGRTLVTHAVRRARDHFRVLRLRTDTREGSLFYAALGFSPVPHVRDATHQLSLAVA